MDSVWVWWGVIFQAGGGLCVGLGCFAETCIEDQTEKFEGGCLFPAACCNFDYVFWSLCVNSQTCLEIEEGSGLNFIF